MRQPSRCPVLKGGRVRYHGHIYQTEKLRPAAWTGAVVIVVAFPGTHAVVIVYAGQSYLPIGIATCRRCWKATSSEKRTRIIEVAKTMNLQVQL